MQRLGRNAEESWAPFSFYILNIGVMSAYVWNEIHIFQSN